MPKIVGTLFIQNDEITTLSLKTSIDGGSEDTRIINAEINTNDITSTIDGGTV